MTGAERAGDARMAGPAAAAPETSPEDPAAVWVEGLFKTYRGPRGAAVEAAVDVSFTVRQGEIFGFLGPNGAGKTTILEIIEGLREPTAGHTYILGRETRRDRRLVQEMIGVQLQSSSYFDYLKLEEILDLFGSFYQEALPSMDLLEAVGLTDKRQSMVRTLSGGQSQRFSIIAALVNDPLVVFLDEPTAGLDPQSRRDLWGMIRQIRDDHGKTIVLTTHYMEEANALCDRVLVIDHGRVQALDTPQNLISQHTERTIVRFFLDTPLTEQLRALPGVTDVSVLSADDDEYVLRVSAPEEALTALLALVRQKGVSLRGLQVQPATLEDVFLSLTGRSLKELKLQG